MEETCGQLNGAEAEQFARVPCGSVGLLPAALVDQVWPIVRPWIEAARAESVQHELTVDDVYQGLIDETYRLLIMGDLRANICATAVIAISHRASDGRPYMALIACGGSHMDAWLGELVEACKTVARSAGCDQIICLGRPGWVRVLRGFGLEHKASVMTLDLGGGDGIIRTQ